MASPGSDAGRHLALQLHLHHHHHHTEPAVRETQRWIEAVTGRSFGDRDFRGGLDNGILLCELLNSIKPGLVKKINRLPTPVAALDNVAIFLKGCEELGLKSSQLFDPGDLQDPSIHTNKGQDINRKLKNVLITIYWLGRAANSSATYNGPTLDLNEFEGLLSQMRKEAEDCDSPKRSIRDSGYIDSCESERSDSLSPPRHTRDDSFDSLDSIGSRSRQTPSPDGLLAQGYSDGRGSDSEGDTSQRKMPDVRKDDMLVRRTSCSELRTVLPFNQYLPNRSNQSSYLPAPVRCRPRDREDSRKSWSNATSPVGGERPFSEDDLMSSQISCVVAVNEIQHVDLEAVETDPNKQYDLMTSEVPDYNNPQLSDPQIRLHPLPQDHTHHSAELQPVAQKPSDSQKMEEKETERDGSVTFSQSSENITSFLLSDLQMLHNQTAGNNARFSRSSSVFDDSESVSMFDVRSDDLLSPHSQTRHELMHNQHNKLKEDEDHWQDDLARWKSRRRSVSQDLIKKEEERKMMERLMSGDEGSQRRKSIKTYREIVEEKERREQELHEAYRNARTPEEAAAVLQGYALRFTISEAVLERLKLPKLLERSVSADPTRHSHLPVSQEPTNLLQYLRQQSLPAPKFTATVETRVTGHTVEPGTTGDDNNGFGPALSPEPYRQSKSPDIGLRTAQVDETVRVNGERDGDVHNIEEEEAEEPDRQRDSLQFFPSPSQHTEIRQTDASEISSTHDHQTEREMTEIEGEMILQVGGVSITSEASESVTDEGQSTEDHTNTTVNRSESEQNVIQTDSTPVKKMESPQKLTNRSEPSSQESSRNTPEHETETAAQAHGHVSPAVLNLKRGENFSWNPEEERRRQERWQEEQERVLQEKYLREQQKLKQEWEQAQKEVEEEERRYHEEEQKILEETVTPLTPHAPITPSSLPNTHSTLHSQPEWKHTQGTAEKQTTSEICRHRENNISSTAQNQPSLQMTVSGAVQSCETVSQSSGQRSTENQSQEKRPTLPADVPPANRQPPQQNESWKKNTSQTKPGGRRRSGSVENNGPNSSTSPSFTDTQSPPSPNRSVSGKKLCSSCGHPLGKGAAMIIETLSLYFHIQCFKCGICKGQLGDTSTGTDVRIRNGLLNCQQCYIRSRSAGQPTTL